MKGTTVILDTPTAPKVRQLFENIMRTGRDDLGPIVAVSVRPGDVGAPPIYSIFGGSGTLNPSTATAHAVAAAAHAGFRLAGATFECDSVNLTASMTDQFCCRECRSPHYLLVSVGIEMKLKSPSPEHAGGLEYLPPNEITPELGPSSRARCGACGADGPLQELAGTLSFDVKLVRAGPGDHPAVELSSTGIVFAAAFLSDEEFEGLDGERHIGEWLARRGETPQNCTLEVWLMLQAAEESLRRHGFILRKD